MVDNWKIFISSSKHWRHFIMLLYCQSFSFYGKCSVKIFTVTSSLEHHHLELCGNYKQKCPIRWILFLEAPPVNFRQTKLLPYCRPGTNCVLFYKVKTRQPWNLWEDYAFQDQCGGAFKFWDFDLKNCMTNILIFFSCNGFRIRVTDIAKGHRGK